MPGEYFFSAHAGAEGRIKMNLEADRTYYIKCYINPGFWVATCVLEPVDSITAAPVIAGGMLKPTPAEKISAANKNTRMAITMYFGGGFQSIPWFVDENGDNVNLSTGGGFGIGMDAGFLVSRNFDISLSTFFRIVLSFPH